MSRAFLLLQEWWLLVSNIISVFASNCLLSLVRKFFIAVKHACKDQRTYYENLLVYSRQHLMLYPYHLSDFMIRGLRVTPFAYYHGMMKDIMSQEKSYDSLPNFTAADCEYRL